MRTKKILAFLTVAIFLVSLAAWARFEVDNSGRPFFDGLILGGSTPLKFEGNTVNGIATTFQITDPSVDRTFTFPNASMIIAGQDVNNSFSATQTISSTSPQLTLSNTGTATLGVDTGGVLTVDPSGGDVNIASGDNLTVNGSGTLGMGAGSTGHINLGGSGNVKLNSNYISGDGDDEGIQVESDGQVAFNKELSDSDWPFFSVDNSGAGADQSLSHNSKTTINFGTEIQDTANAFASDTFTVPIAGVYQFCASWVQTGTLVDQSQLRVSIDKTNGSAVVIATMTTMTSGTAKIPGPEACGMYKAALNDTIVASATYFAGSGTSAVTIGRTVGQTFFQGVRIK